MYRTPLPIRALALLALTALAAGCSGGGSNPGPSSTPTSSSFSSAAYTCSTSDSVSSVASAPSASGEATRRAVNRRTPSASQATGLIAVTYSGAPAAAVKTLAAAREASVGGSLVRETTYANIGRYERIVRVTPGSEAQALATLRTQAGVVAASITGTSRSLQTVASKYYSNDPYYNGFTSAQLATAGSVSSPTYHVDPYEENANVGGQWEMHAVRLDYAQAYSQAGNGSGITNAGALGSAGVKIAIIDSGEDSTQPEIASKIVYQKCFITNPNGAQSVSNYSIDQFGHGTDVAGIAADSSNNNLGFVGTGGAATILAYRVFPQPDDTCVPGYTKTVSSQCYTNVLDIVSAINDAVAQKVNVINLSLGGDPCTNGVDPDTAEQNAVASALANNIVVVAASGNGGSSVVGAPGCVAGVIAVGASALNDGVATGTSSAPVGSAAAPVEYVTSYSQYGSPGTSVNNPSAWGIVAPGGDPNSTEGSSSSAAVDDLHWIQNIWTSTPLDTAFASGCKPDFGSVGGIADCRTLIAGTSQATPMVAGAAALIIAANPSYQSPTKMKQLLCSTAHDIGSAFEGCGRLDIYRAMATALGDPSLPASK